VDVVYAMVDAIQIATSSTAISNDMKLGIAVFRLQQVATELRS